ncbi:MAG: adenine nucleotide alpha hydrolase family protein [Chloroflexi bacterium]|nr:adenine nucleotide alpha hydrolase family protein [Chloroflexota bacterium]
MRCTRCRDEAWVEVRRHNASYCGECFVRFFHDQVEKAIKHDRMFSKDEKILVAVSGGKDSLALWDVLLDLGYDADGLYIDLGIGEYSSTSREMCEQFAAPRERTLHVAGLDEQYGVTVPLIASQTRRAPCSGCGLAKRYLFNHEASTRGYGIVATGHNLDDEAATLLGNVLHWQTGYLARQSPVLEAEDAGLVRKVKPLYRLSEHETAAYAVIRGIEYVVEECPNAVGAKSILHKEALNVLEAQSPGTKQAFLFGFLDKGRAAFAADDPHELRPCVECEQPTTTERCAFCRLLAETRGPKRPSGRPRRRVRRGGDTKRPATV